MHRVIAFKHAIRLGIRFVPNRLGAYRLFSHLAPLIIRKPAGCDADWLTIGSRPALWLAHSRHCDSRVMLYLHGGGYTIGSNRTHVELAARLAHAARAQVLMLEYRLAPEHPFPAAIDDVLAAYRYLLDHRVSAGQILLAGDSAGGGLAVASAMAIRDMRLPTPAGVVGLSPWLDLSCRLSSDFAPASRDPLITPSRIRFFAAQYAGEQAPEHPWMSPLYGDLRDLPPMLIQVGSDEILLSECRAFHRQGQQTGSNISLQEWPNMFHVWHIAAALLPEGRLAIDQVGRFARQVAPAPGIVREGQNSRRKPRVAYESGLLTQPGD